ncbi:S1/P1 nuclease-domain-containing protein [Lactarius quietus]|nr:S1/P1 nuclease-domain-containing protein [Lactarius quietus]
MRTFLFLNVTAIAGLSSLPRALAWGAAGHEIVATIAQSHLDPQVLNSVCSILASDNGVSESEVRDDAPCYLATVAAWADKNRNHMRWSAPLHYVGASGDHPPDNCLFPGSDGWQGHPLGNVLDAIHNVTSILSDFVSGSSSNSSADARTVAVGQAQEALKFLIHFVGDMHQPLHLTGRDRGGNGIKVTFGRRHTNLHSVWDTYIIAKQLRNVPRKYTRPLPVPALESALRGTIYDPYVRRVVWEGIGVGRGTARWESEADSWLTCPGSSSQSGQQFVLGAPRRGVDGPPQTSDSDTLCPYAWATPIHKLNCDIVWPADLDFNLAARDDEHEHGHEQHHHHHCGSASVEDEMRAWEEGSTSATVDLPDLDTPEYAGRIEREWIIEQLLAQGGIRLAGILNALFAPQ